MGKKYLIDTNVLIEYLGNLLPNYVAEKVGNIVDEDFNISFRKSSKIKLPDAILAATAVTYDLVLLTR